MTRVYFEDIEIGSFLGPTPEHQVSENEIVKFAQQWDPYPFHTDPVEAERSLFGGLTASSGHTFAISLRLGHLLPADVPRWVILAGLGINEMSFPNPVRPGDRLSQVVETLSKRESASKLDRGIVEYRVVMSNQRSEPVLSLKQTAMVARRPADAPAV